ncbi:phytase [Nocardioides speluncae]|uniref:phytase n=1 Tax=Nocardioides speluncae TaxID=2670337 RepID=UPI00197F7D98|nr:phytase [Nocardioides speluncae]
MVVDPQHDVLYAAQEDVGVWRIPLQREAFGRPVLIDRVREFGRDATYDPETEECTVSAIPHPDSGTHLSADAEGLTSVRHRNRSVTLIVSSQGDNRFVEYTLRGRYLRTFTVAAGAVDSVEHSDGTAVTTAPLGPRFPTGLLVVHDGENTPAETADGEVRENTNFKLVPWSS